MTDGLIALGILATTLVVAFGLSIRAGGATSLEQWSLGNRGFGTVFVFMLLAGEIYTTFTFLGGSGWAYGRGAPAFYIVGYAAVAYVLSYWLLPAIWRRASAWRVLTQPEFFARAYDSPALGQLVSVVSLVALVPYLVLQLKGLGIIVSETSYGTIDAATAIWVGMLATVLYVVLAGVKGSAYTAALKDALVLASVVGLGIALPATLHGGIGPMFDRIIAERPDFLVLPARGLSGAWFASTVLLTVCGFYMWPHTFGTVFTARSEDALRRNAALMPLYQIILLFVFFIGFAALLAVPGLEGADADLALVRVTKLAFGPWVVGLVGAAGLLTALVPGSLMLLTCATILARLVRRDEGVLASVSVARAFVPLVAAVALLLAFRGGQTLVTLLLLAYSIVTQLFPALVGALVWPRFVTASGAIAGLLVGEVIVAVTGIGSITLGQLLPSWPAVVTDVNPGVIALLSNTASLVVVSALQRKFARPRHLSASGD
ncbi:MAG: sodium:solute symporter [Gemmatimonas sp.]|jgi:SSS family solute:Na+ symporter|uniref:sodium:solute symporter family protein n=1 Tax=Gemmatimonas sp. TaxID=1962908 RepID=UPI00391F0403|nr:sodium:solute symporter family protein [Gemmatimonadota bacterium]